MSITASYVLNEGDEGVEEEKGTRKAAKTLKWLIHSFKEKATQYVIANKITTNSSLIGHGT